MKKFIHFLVLASFVLVQGCASAPVWQSVNQAATAPTLESSLEFDHIEGDGREDGKGYIPYLKALKTTPKRVALVSVYAIDPVTAEKGTDQTTIRWMTTAGAKAAANEMYQNGFNGMKEGFAAHGMTLLAPAEYLTDDAKKEFYASYELKKSTTNRAVSGVMNFFKGIGKHGHDPVIEYADGFTPILIENAGLWKMGTSTPDDTFTNSLGSDLAKGLGVDAVVIVYSQFKVHEKATEVTETNMYLFGPNPVAIKEGEEGFFGSRPGHHYAGVRAPFKFTYLGTDAVPANYDGYEQLLKAMSNKIGAYLESKIGSKVEPKIAAK